MNDESSLSELPALCERLSEPDRYLDGLIFKAIYEKPGDDWTDNFDGIWHRRDPADHCAFDSPPNFTASLDAAMSLVPDDHTIYLTRPSQTQPYDMQNRSYACVAPKGLGGPQYAKKRAHLSSFAATLALALCSAAMKAHSVSERAEGEEKSLVRNLAEP